MAENILIHVYESLAQYEEATTECLLVCGALLKALEKEHPRLMESYHRFHDEDASASPLAAASHRHVLKLRGIAQSLKQAPSQE